MALLEIDRRLLQRCVTRKPHAWEDFVDRFIGLVIHVIRHTANSRTITLTSQDEEDLAAEFFLVLIDDDYAVLRRFRGQSSLATYLTVIARRVVVRQLTEATHASQLHESAESGQLAAHDSESPEERIGNHEVVERLLQSLSGAEADVVRLYHLEGRSYREISEATGMPENSIGPTLSRAREKMRQAVADPTA